MGAGRPSRPSPTHSWCAAFSIQTTSSAAASNWTRAWRGPRSGRSPTASGCRSTPPPRPSRRSPRPTCTPSLARSWPATASIRACFLAAEFHIPRVLVPLAPGTLCALGALSADVKSDYVKTVNLKLGHTAVDELGAHFAELRRRAEEWLTTEGPSVLGREITYSADM